MFCWKLRKHCKCPLCSSPWPNIRCNKWLLSSTIQGIMIPTINMMMTSNFGEEFKSKRVKINYIVKLGVTLEAIWEWK